LSGRCHDPSRQVDGDAADVVATQIDLAGVQPGSELDADAGQLGGLLAIATLVLLTALDVASRASRKPGTGSSV
jgi:hypothetical protein